MLRANQTGYGAYTDMATTQSMRESVFCTVVLYTNVLFLGCGCQISVVTLQHCHKYCSVTFFLNNIFFPVLKGYTCVSTRNSTDMTVLSILYHQVLSFPIRATPLILDLKVSVNPLKTDVCPNCNNPVPTHQ